MAEPDDFDQAYAEICKSDAPLSGRLSALSGIIRTHAASFADAYDEFVSRIISGEAGSAAPVPGQPMPRFILPGPDGHLVDSESLLAEGPLVISLNRGHWCEYCDLQLRCFALAHLELARHGARVVSIMPEKLAYTKQVADRVGHAFQVLSDMDSSYALELNLAVWLGDRITGLLRAAGVDLIQAQGNGMSFVPIPATFVVAKGGIIEARFVDPDFRHRMTIEEILAALEQLSGRA